MSTVVDPDPQGAWQEIEHLSVDPSYERPSEDVFAALRWFHAIDFGEFASCGRFRPGHPQNVTLYGVMDLIEHIDLTGATVLDIGAADGLVSFAAAHLGAARVVATDTGARPTFRLAQAALAVEVDYLPGAQIRDLGDRFGSGTFDLIVCSGVVYHMLNPASAFFECRKLVKEGGLVLFETVHAAGDDRAAIYVNSEEQLLQELGTYSVPTTAAVAGLMRLACFDVLAIRTLAPGDRVTVLGRAVLPDEVTQRTQLTRRIHEVDFVDNEFRIANALPTPSISHLVYDAPFDEQVIDFRTYTPSFPFHPPRDKRVVGTTAWTTPDGNR